MHGGIEVDRVGLRNAAGPFQEDAETLISIFTALQDAIDQAGSCWGGDDLGTAFADGPDGYRTFEEEVMGSFGGLVDALGQITQGVEHMAGLYDDAEADLV